MSGPVLNNAMQACRSMLHGILKVLGLRSSMETKPVRWLQPLTISADKRKHEEKMMQGSLPHRVVALAADANEEELALNLHWIGPGQLRCVCMLYKEDGSLLRSIWEGEPKAPGIQYCRRDPDYEDAGEDEEVSELLKGDALLLRLQKLPAEVFALSVAMVATEVSMPWASKEVMGKCQELALTLLLKRQRLWKYRQPRPGYSDVYEVNVQCSCCLYRGPRNTWRLEPMNMPLMLLHLNKVEVPSAFAVSEIARHITLKIGWMIQDRRWTTCTEERGLRVSG